MVVWPVGEVAQTGCALRQVLPVGTWPSLGLSPQTASGCGYKGLDQRHPGALHQRQNDIVVQRDAVAATEKSKLHTGQIWK